MFADGAETRNVALGAHAARFCDGTDDNIAIGYGALSGSSWSYPDGDTANATKPSGNENIAIGSYVLDANQTGTSNVGIGHNTLTTATIAIQNTAVGSNSLQNLLNSHYNTAVGNMSGYATTGAQNTLIGQAAGQNATSIANSIAVGFSALKGDGTTAPTGDHNTAIGAYALGKVTTGNKNIAIGNYALEDSNSAAETVAIGYSALANISDNYYNVAVGSGSSATSYDPATGVLVLTIGNHNLQNLLFHV